MQKFWEGFKTHFSSGDYNATIIAVFATICVFGLGQLSITIRDSIKSKRERKDKLKYFFSLISDAVLNIELQITFCYEYAETLTKAPLEYHWMTQKINEALKNLLEMNQEELFIIFQRKYKKMPDRIQTFKELRNKFLLAQGIMDNTFELYKYHKKGMSDSDSEFFMIRSEILSLIMISINAIRKNDPIHSYKDNPLVKFLHNVRNSYYQQKEAFDGNKFEYHLEELIMPILREASKDEDSFFDVPEIVNLANKAKQGHEIILSIKGSSVKFAAAFKEDADSLKAVVKTLNECIARLDKA